MWCSKMVSLPDIPLILHSLPCIPIRAVRINSPKINAAAVTATLGSASLTTSLGTAMTVATGSAVKAEVPEVKDYSPTAAPVLKSGAHSVRTQCYTAQLTVVLTVGALVAHFLV